MQDFFDIKSYVDFRLPQSGCCSCGHTGLACIVTAAAKKRFREMTGLRWQGGPTITLPIRKDLASLGVNSSEVPERIPLCADCAIRYMTTFNERLDQHRLKENEDPGKADS